ncbi:LysR family transcriptional regulator [Myxococcaceae bacterium GXIMD 01537]
MSDRLSGIAVFVQVAEAGSFALAAKRLGLTRSAVGKGIARLEQRLGVRLFHRTTRSQSLTHDGQAFYERCARVLAELEAAEAELEHGRKAPSGRLRVTAPVMFGRLCVAPVLLELARRHPRLELELSLSDRMVDLVEEGVDLAVRLGPLADRAGLVSRRLGVQRMVVCGAPAYVAKRGRPKKLADLERHDGVVYAKPGSTVPWRFLDDSGGTREASIRSRFRFDDLEAIASAAVAGAGLAWLPHWLVARRLRDGELVQVVEAERGFLHEVHAVWPQTRHLPTKVRFAVDALVASIPALLADGQAAIASQSWQSGEE